MANEIQILHNDASETIYAIVRETTARSWWFAGTTAEVFEAANWATYDIALTAVDTSSPPTSGNIALQGTFPALAAGTYLIDTYIQTGATPAQTDFYLGSRRVYWDGITLILSASNISQVGGVAQTAGDIVALVGNIAIVGSPSYEASSSFAVNSASVTETNDYTFTDTTNNLYHVLTPAATAINATYSFVLGGDEVATSLTFKGRLFSNPTSSRTVVIKAWDWTATIPAFVTVATINAVNTDSSSNDITVSPILVSKYTGTGVNLGKVDIQVLGSGLTTATPLYVDQLVVGKTNTSNSVGYSDGSVWVDTTNGTSGTEAFRNGTADKPCLYWADAKTIAAAVGIKSFHFLPGSSITLDSSVANTNFTGDVTIALGGQYIEKACFNGCYNITGVSSGQDAIFNSCGIQTVSIEHCYFTDCRFKGILTMLSGATKDWYFLNCSDTSPGGSAASIFVNITSGQVMFRNWRGGINIQNHKVTNDTIIDGAGRLIIDSTSTAGNITIRGDFPPATSGVEFINNGGNIVQTQRWGTDVLRAVDNIIASATDGTTFVLTGSKAVDNAYNGMSICVIDNTDSTAEVRKIVDYTSGGQVTIDRTLTFTPTSGDVYYILQNSYNSLIEKVSIF